MERKLTYKQARFVEEYISNKGNATQAATKAGYSPKTAFVQGCNLLKNVKIQRAFELKTRQTNEYSKFAHNQEAILAEISRIAERELKCPVCNRGFAASESTKIKALELLGKYHAMWTEKVKSDVTLRVKELLELSEDETEQLEKELFTVSTN